MVDSSASSQARFGPYDLLEPLHSDRTTESFVARQDGARDLVMLKRLRRPLRNNNTAGSRFAREAEIARRLDHPHLVFAVDRGRVDGVPYVAMELVLGCTLRMVLSALADRGEHLPLPHFVTVADAILKGLHFAHGATDDDGRPLGIVHRDLSPHNILVTFTGDVRIKDFALARARTGEFKTVVGMTVGTAAYLSPEQARGYPLDGRSDLFTLGIMFHEVLSGRPVVTQAALVDMIRFILEQNPPRLRPERADIPAALDEVLRFATAKSPRDRYKNAEEMREAVVAACGVKTGADPDALGAFVRSLLPEEEKRVIDLLRRVRQKAASLSRTAGLDSKPAADFDLEDTEDVPPVRNGGPAYAEGPPGASSDAAGSDTEKTVTYDTVSLRRIGLARRITALRRRFRRMSPAVVVAVVVLVVGGAALVVGRIGQDGAGSSEAVPPVRLSPKVPREPAGAASPRRPPVDARLGGGRPAGAAPTPVGEGPVEPPPAEASPREPPPALIPGDPPPLGSAPSRRPRDPLADQLATLRANPEDLEAFDRLHEALRRRVDVLPARTRAPIVADLDAAERTLDVELLARALARLRRAPGGEIAR